ncbi:coenzyme F420-0:L-glutamate ligase [Candidatus Bathyarchaeota archaeon]|nr:coenzyme F420-0:L-glutamate ligase [Candidatus Bathyarchaeota archaeon]
MRLYAVRTGIVETGDNIVEVTLESLKRQNLQLEDGDILALTSKIVTYAEGRVAKLSDIEPSEEAKELAKKFSLQPEFAELVLQEADIIYGGVERAVLTLKNGVLTANAGIDNKNAPVGFVVLWPKNVKECAKRIREEIKRITHKRIAVLIVDSGLVPLRLGTNGLALAIAGFKPVMDFRGKEDLFGKPLAITQHAVADDLASAAHLLMGETTEKTPIVLIKEAPVVLDEGVYGSKDMMIPSDKCIFINAFRHP